LELHVGAELLAKAIGVLDFLEGGRTPRTGQLLESARRIHGPPSTAQQLGADVGGEDVERRVRERGLDGEVPREPQAVGLFTRGAAGAPRAHDVLAPNPRRAGELGQDLCREHLEYAAVAVEARDADPAALVE
jgi:hypothetical protein